jgi:hypothetical protein
MFVVSAMALNEFYLGCLNGWLITLRLLSGGVPYKRIVAASPTLLVHLNSIPISLMISPRRSAE